MDAYPGKRFSGTVEQVRLNPTVVSNVVTYAAIITAPNPSLELKPGMTANVTVEASRRYDVLRVPNAALRFRPTDEILKALQVPAASAASGKPASPSATATVWVQAGESMVPATVRVGASDGVNTEVLDGALQEGAAVVTRVVLPGATTSTAVTATSSPLMPTGPPRR